MEKTLIKPHSPMDRVQRRRAVELEPSAPRLSREEQEELKTILSEPADYVDDERFARKDAYKVVFEDAPPIPTPNTSWYHPVMEDLGTERDVKPVVNVVLSPVEERAVFLQFNYARFRLAQLKEEVGHNPLTERQARQLLKWHRLSNHLRDQIAQLNLALVLAMAKRVRHSDMDFADLISEGNMALLRAIDKFNVSRGFKFSTYACRAILKAFSRSGMKHSQYRQLFPTDFDPALERSDHQRRKYDQHEDNCAEEVRGIVLNNRAGLSEVEQAVIKHRFPLGEADNSSRLTLEQVGQVIGLTKERVRQIQNKALEKIRRTLEESYLDGSRALQVPEPAPVGQGETD